MSVQKKCCGDVSSLKLANVSKPSYQHLGVFFGSGEESEVHRWCCGTFVAVCADFLFLLFNPTSSSNVN
jgi:hypothetical protein